MDTLIKLGTIILLLFLIIFPVYQIFKHKSGAKYNKSLFRTRTIDERTTDIPLEGSITAASYVLTYSTTWSTPSFDFPKLYLMKWFAEGRTELRDGLIAFTDMAAPKDKFEKDYYKIFMDACGEDRVIHKGRDVFLAFDSYSQKDHKGDSLLDIQMNWFKKHGYIEKEKLVVPLLTETGAAEARKVISLRNYLQDVAAGTEKLTRNNGHLKDYLAYACLFEIGNKFKETLEDVLPDDIKEYYDKAVILAKAAYDGLNDITDGLEYDDD